MQAPPYTSGQADSVNRTESGILSISSGFAAQLRAAIGAGAVLEGDDATAPYVTDFWRLSTGRTPLVARPTDTAGVQAVMRLCHAAGVPVIPQAGNTGLAGGGVPDRSNTAIVLSVEGLNRIRAVSAKGGYLVAEAGCILHDLHEAAEGVDRLLPLSLGAEGSCRIGGNVSTNAGGNNVLRYGMARRMVLGLEVVLADGTLLPGLRTLPKDNRGYDLKQLFIGAEGTLGIVTAVALQLSPRPRERLDVWFAVERPERALDLLDLFRDRMGETISAFELVSGVGVTAGEQVFGTKILAEAHPWHVLATVAWSFESGLAEKLDTVIEAAFEQGLAVDGTIAQNEAQRLAMWRVREQQSEAMTRSHGPVWRADVSVPIDRVPELIAACERIVPTIREDIVLFPFGHVGDGNLHVNATAAAPSALTPDDRQRLQDAVFEIVASLDGSFSAEHGVGRWKRQALGRYKDPAELALMRQLKRTLDPQGLLNPGVIFEPEATP